MKLKYRLNPHIKFDEVRLFRFFLATLIVLFFVATPLRAYGETGSISILDEKLKTYNSINGGGVHPWNGSIMRIDNSSYNKVVQVTLTLDATNSFLHESNYTTFTVIDNGTGTGYVTYSAYDRNITWFFSSSTITGQYVRLQYDVNIFKDISSGAGGAGSITQGDSMSYDQDTPIFMATGNPGSNASSVKGKYYSWVGVTATNLYTVNYLPNNLFQLNVNKSISNINTRWTVHDVGNVSQYYSESTLNHNDIQVIRQQLSGIYANVSLISGAHSDFAINITQLDASGGTIGVPFTFNNPPLTIPSSGGSIQFNKTQYTVGDTVRIEWAISNNTWQALGSTFKIFLFKNNNPALIDGTSALQVSSQQQQGNYSFVSTEVAGLTVKLYGGDWSTLFAASNLLGTAYTTVLAETPATVFVNSSVPIKTNTTAAWNYGVGGVSAGSGFILINYLNPVTGLEEFESSYSIGTTTGSTQIQFFKLGTYNVHLKGSFSGKSEYAQTTVKTSFVPIITKNNFASSSIKIDSATYNMGGVINGNYTVDSTNYSKGTVFIDLYNVGLAGVTAAFYSTSDNDLSNDYGKFSYYIMDFPAEFNLPAQNFEPGNNQIRLRLQNATDGTLTTLATANFNLSTLTTSGYGLDVKPLEAIPNQKITVKVTIPISGASIEIWDFDRSKIIKAVVINSSGVFQWSFPLTGTYTFNLKNPSNNTEISVAVVIKSAIGIAPAAPSSGWSKNPQEEGYTAGLIDGQVSLLGMGVNNSARFLFSMVWVILFLVGGFVVTGRNANGGLYAAMLPFLFFTSLSFIQVGVEYIPRYGVIIIAFILVIKLGIVR